MSFQQGLSGLNASSKNLEVIGHNIANAQTYGAKSSRAEFADMYATALNGAGTNEIGIGVQLQAVAQQFTQGSISVTENPMDLAINGNGFFQVSDGKSPTMYTRNGQFKVDKDGYIVNNDQLKLQGYPADGNGVIQPGLATSLKLPTGGIEPKVTDDIAMEFTLDSRAAATAPYELSDPADPNSAKIDQTGLKLDDPKSYNNATSMTVYDAKGQPIAVTMYYQRANNDDANGNTVWNVYVTANGSAVQYDAQGNPIETDDGTATGNPLTPYTTMTFLPTGGNPVSPGPNELLNLKIPAGVNSQGAPTLSIPAPPADLSDPSVAGISLDMRSAVENGSNFAVTSLSQDGYAPGQLTGISIEDNGTVTARYSNGQSKPAGQIELATFRNPQGLQPLGGNLWLQTNASGSAVVGVPGDGNLGSLNAGALEESNVDLTNELVNMVTAQRVYQANAQTIKTQDQVLQTLVNLR
ncbi:flagellar hook protein FlgE [Roseateles sp. YR242]|uniref:flagellar hook protein FlgE n=1 Tax=Roseateles sp. YR242 TaxID=1855305 RepID=UPI0008C07ED1|nr:flagellar hook protein FlgE [Roseateles sp. YR242]SEL44593.1 flagellar hook protein FlgE [Roseateles sp. YR242]